MRAVQAGSAAWVSPLYAPITEGIPVNRVTLACTIASLIVARRRRG